MIKAILENGKRMYIPLSRVVAVSENDEGQLMMSNMNSKDEVVWRPVVSFEVLSAGRKQS